MSSTIAPSTFGLSAATLAAVGTFLAPSIGEAAVVLFEPAAPIESTDYSGVINWTPDELVASTSLSATGRLSIFGCNGFSIDLSRVGDDAFDTRVILSAGDIVSSASSFSGLASAFSGYEGPNFFIGYNIAIGPNTHYGWAEFSYSRTVPGDPRPLLDLKRWAYETEPDTAITVGAAPIPEPASVTLLAGAAALGLVIGARRRRAR